MIYEGKKLGGNAQRRTKNLIHQHGSIPLRSDKRDFAGHSLEEFDIKLSEVEAKKLLAQSFIETFEAVLITEKTNFSAKQ
jgi:lipoate-protein ligase A